MALQIGRRRIKFRFLVFLTIVVASAVYLYHMSRPPAAYEAVSYGELTIEHQAQALIIREESVFTSPIFGRVTCLSSDGETVMKDQLVARLYKDSFDQELVFQLYDIQDKIISYQQENIMDQVLDGDFKKLEKDINAVVSEIQTLIRNNNLAGIGKKETKLRELMSAKQKILDKRSSSDSHLQSLYEQESDLLLKLKDWSMDVKSPKSGIISYYVDGLEVILGKSSVDKLTLEDLRQLLEKPAAAKDNVKQAEAEQPLYRIVNPEERWFAAFETSADVYYKKGDTVDVKLFSASEDTLTGTVYRLEQGKKSTLVILEMTSDVTPVLNKRTAALSMSKLVQGIIVPENALRKSKGMTGVEVKDRESNVFIETSIKGVSDGFVVVEPVSLNQEINPQDMVRIR